MRLVDEHGVILMSVALAVLKPLQQSLTKRFFVLSFVKANAVSLTSPLMKGQASHIGCLCKKSLEIFRKRAIEAQYEHLFVGTCATRRALAMSITVFPDPATP